MRVHLNERPRLGRRSCDRCLGERRVCSWVAGLREVRGFCLVTDVGRDGRRKRDVKAVDRGPVSSPSAHLCHPSKPYQLETKFGAWWRDWHLYCQRLVHVRNSVGLAGVAAEVVVDDGDRRQCQEGSRRAA